MPWSYRKSKKVGPFRVNVSKRGVGYSVGNKYYRTGKTARGQRYVSSSPLPGLRYRKNIGKQAAKSGCVLPMAIIVIAVICLAVAVVMLVA